MSTNTHPNTPFGKFFAKKGVWHPKAWDTIGAIIHNPKDFEKEVVSEVETWLQKVKTVVQDAPSVIIDKSGISKDEIQHQLVQIDEWLKQLAD